MTHGEKKLLVDTARNLEAAIDTLHRMLEREGELIDRVAALEAEMRRRRGGRPRKNRDGMQNGAHH